MNFKLFVARVVENFILHSRKHLLLYGNFCRVSQFSNVWLNFEYWCQHHTFDLSASCSFHIRTLFPNFFTHRSRQCYEIIEKLPPTNLT